MKRGIDRRTFLRGAGAAGAGLWLSGASPQAAAAPREKLSIACFGVGGRGGANFNAVVGENVVALCDVDDQQA